MFYFMLLFMNVCIILFISTVLIMDKEKYFFDKTIIRKIIYTIQLLNQIIYFCLGNPLKILLFSVSIHKKS